MKKHRTPRFVMLFLGVAVALLWSGADLLAAPGVGDDPPDFTLQDTDGNWHTLSDYTGQVIMLDFLRST